MVAYENPLTDWDLGDRMEKSTLPPTVSIHQIFRDLCLTQDDEVVFANVLLLGLNLYGRESCWPMAELNHAAFEGFSRANKHSLVYSGVDARPLLLAMSGRFADDGEVAMRLPSCDFPHCLNPMHYKWGTRSEVMLTSQKMKKSNLSVEVINKLRMGRQEGKALIDLAFKYQLSYSTVQKICSGKVYTDLNQSKAQLPDEQLWTITENICKMITDRYAQEQRQFRVDLEVSNLLECPWHRKGSTSHKGNFGLMGECLDCMEKIKNGRCTVDVTQFDMRWYWQVRRFWEQVDIGGEDDCWVWTGATRKNNTESIAYFPSPFHSGKTQSASRVAFWLSRGYTGKYRIFSKKECEPFCCNPKHLTIRELKNFPEPSEISEIKITHENIFEHARKAHAEAQSGLSDQLPPS